MYAVSVPRRLARILNAVLRPLGVELRRREAEDRARRATYAGGLEHLKRAGFQPRTVIDVGVPDGTPALYRAFPDARHVLIEPVEECRPHLDAIKRQFRHVEYVIAARRAVTAVTLDQLRRERAIEGPILLKIDVQGAELDVLAGAQDTLADTECVVLETSLFEFFRGAPLIDQIVAYMSERGFAVYDVLALQYRPFDGALMMVDLAFVKTNGFLRRLHRFHPTQLQ